MTNDNFTDAARAEAERVARENTPLEYGSIWDAFVDAYAAGLQARDHLAAQEPTDEECIYILSIVCSPFGEEDKKSEWAPAGIQRCREAMVRARAARRDEGDR